jgi:hypothetical protein
LGLVFKIVRMALTKVRGLVLGTAVVLYTGLMGLMLWPLFNLHAYPCAPGKDWYQSSLTLSVSACVRARH